MGWKKKGWGMEREVVGVKLANAVGRGGDERAHQVMLQAVRRASAPE